MKPVTSKERKEWEAKWAADRERWAKTYVPGAADWSKAPSSINTCKGVNTKP